MKTSLKKVLWPVLSKPWETPDMEFHYGLWNGVSALYSEGGRQLGEENTRPFALNHHIPAETIDCKYAGSREGRAINMSALRIAMKNFDEALDITGAVRSHHLSRMPSGHVLGIWDLYIIARASIALIAYQKRFSEQKAVEPWVSDALASQYQFISGVFMICRHMMDNGDPAIAKNRAVSADELYKYADEQGIFISFNGMACAGSTKKIHEFLEFCNDGPSAERGSDFDLAQIVCEPDNWYAYALATIELDCFIEQERALRSAATSSDKKDQSNDAAEMRGRLGTYTRKLMSEAPLNDEGMSFEQAGLMRQNNILSLLGRPTIKEIPQRHLKARVGRL